MDNNRLAGQWPGLTLDRHLSRLIDKALKRYECRYLPQRCVFRRQSDGQWQKPWRGPPECPKLWATRIQESVKGKISSSVTRHSPHPTTWRSICVANALSRQSDSEGHGDVGTRIWLSIYRCLRHGYNYPLYLNQRLRFSCCRASAR